jgi:hypothetical protein
MRMPMVTMTMWMRKSLKEWVGPSGAWISIGSPWLE